MGNKDGMAKNLEVIKEGWEDTKDEWQDANLKVRDAIEKKDYRDLLHHLTDYKGAVLQHNWRLWSYLWELKWAAVAYLVFSGVWSL